MVVYLFLQILYDLFNYYDILYYTRYYEKIDLDVFAKPTATWQRHALNMLSARTTSNCLNDAHCTSATRPSWNFLADTNGTIISAYIGCLHAQLFAFEDIGIH